MNLNDLDPNKYPHGSFFRVGEQRYIIAFKTLDAVNIFTSSPVTSEITPVGQIDCTRGVSGELETEVAKQAHEAVSRAVTQSTLTETPLDRLFADIDKLKQTAESLRDTESTATRDNQPGAVGRELSYAIVKLREAAHWVRDASEIKSSVAGK